MFIKSISAKSDQGPYLNVNEDTHHIDLDKKLFQIYDGFGGSGVGDVVVNKLKNEINQNYAQIAKDPDSTLPFFFSAKYLIEGNALINAAINSNSSLFKENVAKTINQKAGASGVLMVQNENLFTVFSTGNCAVFLLRNGKLKPVTISDHYGFLTGDDGNSHLKTCPMSGFGMFSDLHFQVKEVRLYEKDILVALTDGAYSRLSQAEIGDIVGRRDSLIPERIDCLFSLANSRGNLDNQTALFIEY